MVLIIKERATLEQFEQMLQTLGLYIKIAIDIERGILAGGGEKHAYCEAALLEDGSRQRDIWGADWIPFNQSIAYESIINIRPSQNNRSMIIQNPEIRERVKKIAQELIGGYEPERG
ncbi:MAG: hypothetical protein HWQ35_21615 [Nostoc sp. NMS1]|uniref:DUF5674 family protein n=1 Tax=unclassified Nostoc TaxID=2593658 RepID=UPI0025DDDD20|nr:MULTISPECIES: DUF5674 family protein [unclassified Nostoc]MBN3909055.1 hypothetical protein [Nostoc sp. NMS1]MBN3992389.1 hypothetical protein [Nostoc sp. NMS2]